MFYSISLKDKLLFNDKKMNHLFLLTLMLPFDYFIVSEIWFLYLKLSLEKKINQNNNFLAINSPHLITDLAHIDYAILDKTGTITTHKKSLSLIYFKENANIVEFENFPHFSKKLFKSKLNKDSNNTIFLESQVNSPSEEAKIVNCKTFIEETLSFDNVVSYNDLLEAFTICHSIKIEFSNKKQKQIFKFRTKDEKFLFKFAKNLEYDFLNIYKKDNFTYYNLRIRNKILSYKILGVHELDFDNYFLATIYQDSQTNNYIISTKGSSSSLIKILKISLKDKEILDSIMKIFNKKGFLDPLMYAKKVLTELEAEIFIEKHKNLQSSLINQTDSLNDLIKEFLYDLELVGIVGLEEQLDPDIVEFMKFLKSLNINNWILTGDSKQNAYNVAGRIGIFDNTAHQYCIDSETNEELISQLKNVLVDLTNNIKELSKENEYEKKTKQNNQKVLC